MNITIFFAIAVLGCVTANLIHWDGRNEERVIYQPHSGWLRFMLVAWSIASIAAAVLFLFGRISMPAFIGIAMGLTFAHELYSIARRQRQRAKV
jgi:hypothetical protein